jgi:hypothetical protein
MRRGCWFVYWVFGVANSSGGHMETEVEENKRKKRMNGRRESCTQGRIERWWNAPGKLRMRANPWDAANVAPFDDATCSERRYLRLLVFLFGMSGAVVDPYFWRGRGADHRLHHRALITLLPRYLGRYPKVYS